MEMNKDLFEKAPISRAVATMAIPSIISMLVVVIYNMADTFFVGQTGDANQVAAVSIATPVFLVFMAIGNLFGVGGSSAISRAFGRGDQQCAKKISSFCFYGSILIALIMMMLFFGGMDVILKLIGASQNTMAYAREYLWYIALGAPFIVLSNAFGNIIRAEGAVKQAMAGMMVGTIVNIVLDPIMILTLGMGVRGAAIATVIGNIAGTLYYVNYFRGGNTLLSISIKNFTFKNGVFQEVFSVGVPASLNNLLMSMANIILNNFLVLYGDIPVAAMGVAMKANMLVILLQIGLAVGIQPLIGYNYGAKNYKRMNGIIRFACVSTVVLGGVLTAAYVFGASSIIELFIHDEAVVEQGVGMLRALMLSGPVVGILFVFTNVIQAMGKAIPSLVLSLSRQGLVFIPMIVLLNKTFGLSGIVYSQPIADIAASVLSVGIYLFVLRRLHASVKKEEMLEKESDRKQEIQVGFM